MNNLVPLPYSRIGVQRVECELDEQSIKRFFCGKEAYFETDYVVLRRGDACAVASVSKLKVDGLFCPIEDADMLSPPECCRWIDDATVDTGNPSALAEKASALRVADSETLIVNGRYEHVNFIHRPRPLVIDVFDLSPPDPPRLLDMARQVVAYNNFPPVVLRPRIQSILEIIPRRQDKPILFPCGVFQLRLLAQAWYLDERPPRQDWVLVGCDRSRMIHRHVYGADCPRIELCPRKLFATDSAVGLMRCCSVEKGFELTGRVGVVPWGADRSVIEGALQVLVELPQDTTAPPV